MFYKEDYEERDHGISDDAMEEVLDDEGEEDEEEEKAEEEIE